MEFHEKSVQFRMDLHGIFSLELWVLSGAKELMPRLKRFGTEHKGYLWTCYDVRFPDRSVKSIARIQYEIRPAHEILSVGEALLECRTLREYVAKRFGLHSEDVCLRVKCKLYRSANLPTTLSGTYEAVLHFANPAWAFDERFRGLVGDFGRKLAVPVCTPPSWAQVAFWEDCAWTPGKRIPDRVCALTIRADVIGIGNFCVWVMMLQSYLCEEGYPSRPLTVSHIWYLPWDEMDGCDGAGFHNLQI
jgi:hypothetical protein